MEDCLNIVMLNAEIQGIFGMGDLATLKCVTREFKDAATVNAVQMHKSYKKRIRRVGQIVEIENIVGSTATKCEFCNENYTHVKYPFTNKTVCYMCREHVQICKTDAKKKYRLVDDDLTEVDYYKCPHAFYGTEVTYYSLKQVIAQSVCKHGAVPKKRIGSAAKELRILQVNKLRKEFPYGLDNSVDTYIKSGIGGIRTLKADFERFRTVFEHVNASCVPIKFVDLDSIGDDFDVGVYEARWKETCDEMKFEDRRQYINTGDRKFIRQHELEYRLGQHGVSYRLDSYLSQAYIDGTSAKTLDEIVLTMLEMKYLYAETDYPVVIRNLYKKAYRDAREHMYEMHGYIENQYLFSTILNNLVDRDAMAKRAREIIGFKGLPSPPTT